MLVIDSGPQYMGLMWIKNINFFEKKEKKPDWVYISNNDN